MSWKALWIGFLLCITTAGMAFADRTAAGEPPYTLELYWVETTEGWSIRAVMLDGEPGQYMLEAKATYTEPQRLLGAPLESNNTVVAWTTLSSITSSAERILPIDKKHPEKSNRYCNMPIEITVTSEDGNESYTHILEPLEPSLLQASYVLELSWLEREQGWCIRLAMPETEPPGTYLIQAEAVSPETKSYETLDGATATQSTKWQATLRVRPGSEVFIDFGDLDDHTLDLLRQTTVKFSLTPLIGGCLHEFLLAPSQE